MGIKIIDIKIMRGDSKEIIISIVEENETPVPFRLGDIVYFTVKRSSETNEKLLQKVITEFDKNGHAHVEIKPEDTRNIKPRKGGYLYDVQVTFKDGTIKTIIKGNFAIEGDITHE